jgi:hypothetical protein
MNEGKVPRIGENLSFHNMEIKLLLSAFKINHADGLDVK